MAHKPTTPAKKPSREWRVSLIGAKSKYLGRVEATDAESAIAKAAEELRIEPARRFRLIAEPVELSRAGMSGLRRKRTWPAASAGRRPTLMTLSGPWLRSGLKGR